MWRCSYVCVCQNRSDERERERERDLEIDRWEVRVSCRNEITFVEEEYPILTIVPFMFVVVPKDFTAFTPS